MAREKGSGKLDERITVRLDKHSILAIRSESASLKKLGQKSSGTSAAVRSLILRASTVKH